MTWVKGQVQYQNLATKLTQLIAGEVADDIGTTVAVGDRWTRENLGVNALASPTSQERTIPSTPFRQGYWSGNAPNTSVDLTESYVKQTAIGTAPSGVNRWIAYIAVTLVNTVANNYSTLRFQLRVYNLDTGASILNSSNLAPNAAGVYTPVTGSGVGQLSFGSDSGFCNGGFIRCFDTTFLGGIDYWPAWCLRPATTSAPTYGTSPSGTTGTDWDVVSYSYPLHSSASGSVTRNYPCFSSGLGIKTNTGLSGSLYDISHPVSQQKLRILGYNDKYYQEVGTTPVTSSVDRGTLGLEWGGGIEQAGDASGWYRMAGHGQVLATFAPTSFLPTSLVQYWMSVTATSIHLILNGDPGGGGYSNLCTLSWEWPQRSTEEIFARSACSIYRQWSYYDQVMMSNDVDMVGTRDYQVGWGRVNALASWSTWTTNPAYSLATVGNDWGNSKLNVAFPGRETKPHPVDGKWHLYRLTCTDVNINQQAAANNTWFPSYINFDDTLCWLPGDSWQSGDELLDTLTGKRWFIIQPDGGSWPKGQFITGTTYVGGWAVLEV